MDIRIKNEKEEFHVRSCGILKQNNKFLIMNVNKQEYYHIPGGHVEIGEDSKQTVIREIKEEVCCDISKAKLFAIQENFWMKKDVKCQGIEFYYILETNQKLPDDDYERIEIDKGKENILEFKWVTSENLKNVDLRPSSIKDLLVSGEYKNGLKYIVNKN